MRRTLSKDQQELSDVFLANAQANMASEPLSLEEIFRQKAMTLVSRFNIKTESGSRRSKGRHRTRL